VIRLFYRAGIRHEVVTFLSFACGIGATFLIITAESLSGFVVAALLVHLKDVFDACDGALARLTGTGHRIGRFLDTIGDEWSSHSGLQQRPGAVSSVAIPC